jgi:hypothetical protein
MSPLFAGKEAYNRFMMMWQSDIDICKQPGTNTIADAEGRPLFSAAPYVFAVLVLYTHLTGGGPAGQFTPVRPTLAGRTRVTN